MISILISLCLLFDIVYIICRKNNKYNIGLIAKCLASFCFIIMGYLGYKHNNSTFNYYILIGLILDGVGDLFLALRNIVFKQAMFIAGAIAFLLGHIFYIKAQYPIANDYKIQCLIAGVVFGAILMNIFVKVCNLKLGYIVLGIVYCMMICIMASLSVGIFLTNKIKTAFIFSIGSILFMSSDFILVLNQFSKKKAWMHPTYSLLYYFAQILISYSLLLI